MSLFKLFNTGSFHRFWAQRVFALLVLPAVLLVMGCSNPASPDIEILTPGQEWIRDNLAGNWTSDWDEFLRISNTFAFSWGAEGDWGFETTGTVVHIVLFGENENHGVIFIQLDPGMINWDDSPLEGFTGLRFDNLTATQVNAAMASDSMVGATFPTLAEAKQEFTIHTVDTYFANMTSLFQRDQ